MTKDIDAALEAYADFLFGDIQCMHCKNYIKYGRCEAFDLIPTDIAGGRHDHRKPYPNDRGIHFMAG